MIANPEVLHEEDRPEVPEFLTQRIAIQSGEKTWDD